MSLNCDILFSYNNRRQYVGVLNFRNIISMQVQRIYDAGDSQTPSSPSNVPPLHTGAYTGVIVNGVNFGTGRVISFSNPVSTSITENGRHFWKQTVNVEVYTSGDLDNIGSDNAMDNVIDAYSAQLVSLDESFGFQIPQDGGYQYTHSAAIRCTDEPSGAGESGYLIAQRIAQSLLESVPNFGYIDVVHSGMYTGVGRRTYSETVDRLNGTATFEEQLTIQNRDFLKHNVSFDNGFVTISENGLLRHSGIDIASDIFAENDPEGLVGRYNTLFADALTRCSGLWTTYSGFGGQDAYAGYLKTQPAQLTKTFDERTQEFSYSVVFTNNPNMTTNGYAIEREQVFALNNFGVTEASEEGIIKAYNTKETALKASLLTAIGNEIGGVQTRLLAHWAGMASAKLVGESKSVSSHGKEAKYSRVYSDDPGFINDGTFLTKQTAIQDNAVIRIHTPYYVVGFKSPLIHNPGQSQFGNASCTISAVVPRPANYYPATPYKPTTALNKMYNDSINALLKHISIHVPLDVYVSRVVFGYKSDLTVELTTEAQYITARSTNI